MVSNAWSRRRHVIKRPIVCKSKPQVDWPLTLDVTWQWSWMDTMMAQCSYGATTLTMPRLGAGPAYTANVTDDQGHAATLIFTLNKCPTLCTAAMDDPLADTGPTASLGSGPCWDPNAHPWVSDPGLPTPPGLLGPGGQAQANIG